MTTPLRSFARPLVLFVGACLLCLAIDVPSSAEQSWRGTSPDEVIVSLPNGGKVALSTRGPSSFRVRFLYWGEHAEPIDSPMVGPRDPDAPFTEIKRGGTGIKTTFGSILVTDSGSLELYNIDDQLLTRSLALRSSSKSVVLSSSKGRLYGRGAAPDDCSSLTNTSKIQPLVCNKGVYVPYYYSTDGYSALGANSASAPDSPNTLPIEYSTDSDTITWEFSSASDFELFFIPAKTLYEGTKASFNLTGSPAIPPRYAFGFLASRWGWKDRADIEDVMNEFRQGEYPIDALIFDFEWFTNESDYKFKPEGKSYYKDFGYYNVTFPEPQSQLAEYLSKNFKVGGIRKPRLGSTELIKYAKQNGWLLPNGEPGGMYPPDWTDAYALGRNLNYSNPEVRAWYIDQTKHYIKEGMSFWWNDEGETDVFTFYWWNVAEREALKELDPKRRFYSINRAWTPGMARLGATVWTGDIDPTWKDLRGTPGMMLNWVLAGHPYVACDIGGFTGATNAELLARWYQVGTFMPTMRVHSTINTTPHFPFLFGKEAGEAMKAALNLRYRLIPYHYSLAHAQFAGLDLWIKPLVLEYPLDPMVNDSVSQWFDGSILAAPVLGEDSRRDVHLPEGTWYPLAASPSTRGRGQIVGPAHLNGKVDLSVVPAFARSGTVLPLAPVVQSSEELPGGPLEVQVYAGADGDFTLVEDDGITLEYQAGNIRKTTFKWNDKEKTLSWTASGSDTPTNKFTQVFASLITAEGYATSELVQLEATGSIKFSEDVSVVYT